MEPGFAVFETDFLPSVHQDDPPHHCVSMAHFAFAVSTTSSLSTWGLYLQLRWLFLAIPPSASSLAKLFLEVNKRSVDEAYGSGSHLDLV
ncbi:hypothetical protein GALMADRAFT_144343 [Galerina marginata CBS 339.88]|uniref:Uncharacterized protein n=1 Tax=Galerina marginata (strain CBS 339.88) TaxID=685588 RepID=A0A067ST42_GALM3|nr:hypothetical protein GALMADRAFT_144343 [Galerina marginata CBS 339.88]